MFIYVCISGSCQLPASTCYFLYNSLFFFCYYQFFYQNSYLYAPLHLIKSNCVYRPCQKIPNVCCAINDNCIKSIELCYVLPNSFSCVHSLLHISYNYVKYFSLSRFCLCPSTRFIQFVYALSQPHNHSNTTTTTPTHTHKLYVPTPCSITPQKCNHNHKNPSRNNSVSAADYSKLPKNPHGVVQPTNASNGGQMNGSATPSSNGSGPFKPVPPPKPKNYRPPVQSGGSSGSGGTTPWENGVSNLSKTLLEPFRSVVYSLQDSGSPRSPNGFYYPPTPSHHHYGQQTPAPGSPHQGQPSNGHMQQPTYGTNTGNYGQAPPTQQQQQQQYPQANGYNGNSHHYNGGSGTGPYIAPHRGMPPPIGKSLLKRDL